MHHIKKSWNTIGRLGHLGFVISWIYHFLSRIRSLHYQNINQWFITINDMCIKDLELMKNIIEKVNKEYWHYLTHILHPQQNIPLRFVSGKVQGIQQSRQPMAISNPSWSPISSGKQLTQETHVHHHPLDWPACQPPEMWQLHPVDDCLHDRQRMVAKIKLQWSWRITPSSHGPRRLCPPPCSFIHGCKNKRIQSVVCRTTEQHCGHTLSGLAPGRWKTHLNTPSPLPTPDSGALQDVSASQQDQLLAGFTSTVLTYGQAVTEGSHEDKSHTWAGSEKYCLSVGCLDIFTDSLSKLERILLLGAFSMAVRSGRFADLRFNTLAEGTVRGTISNVVQTFQLMGRQNPTKYADNELSILLSRQFRAFRNKEPKEKEQQPFHSQSSTN